MSDLNLRVISPFLSILLYIIILIFKVLSVLLIFWLSLPSSMITKNNLPNSQLVLSTVLRHELADRRYMSLRIFYYTKVRLAEIIIKTE